MGPREARQRGAGAGQGWGQGWDRGGAGDDCQMGGFWVQLMSARPGSDVAGGEVVSKGVCVCVWKCVFGSVC